MAPAQRSAPRPVGKNKQTAEDWGHAELFVENQVSMSPVSPVGAETDPSFGPRGNDPKPDAVASVAGVVPVAKGGAAELGLGAPGAAARDPFLAAARPLRILPGTLAVIILAVPV